MMKQTLYCIGHPENYREALTLTSGPIMMALGSRLFQTKEDARQHMRDIGESEWAIYEVEADWEQDTLTPLKGYNKPFRVLRYNVPIMRLLPDGDHMVNIPEER